MVHYAKCKICLQPINIILLHEIEANTAQLYQNAYNCAQQGNYQKIILILSTISQVSAPATNTVYIYIYIYI